MSQHSNIRNPRRLHMDGLGGRRLKSAISDRKSDKVHCLLQKGENVQRISPSNLDIAPTIADFLTATGENAPRRKRSFKNFINRDLLKLCSKWSNFVVSQTEKDREEQYHEQENVLALDPEIVSVVSTLRRSCARLEVEALELITSFEGNVEGRQEREWDSFVDVDGIENESSNLKRIERDISRELNVFDLSCIYNDQKSARTLMTQHDSHNYDDNHSNQLCDRSKRVSFDKIEPADEVSTPSENRNNEIYRRKQHVSCANQSNQINAVKIVQPAIIDFLLATGEKRPKKEKSIRKLKNEKLLELSSKWSSIVVNNEENEHGKYQIDKASCLSTDPTIHSIVSTLRKSCARLEVEAIDLLSAMECTPEVDKSTERTDRIFRGGHVTDS
mmetsp:Transcript_54294/g.63447  ORF Transcript_54294/g.63447 Transcript_54294/m.63447 type:complete len:388 (+) Transcript_54294:121-1284(+)